MRIWRSMPSFPISHQGRDDCIDNRWYTDDFTVERSGATGVFNWRHRRGSAGDHGFCNLPDCV